MHQTESGKTRFNSWDETWLRMCRLISLRSKDPSTQTGCVVTRDNRVLSLGYNGFPEGVDDAPERYANRELKYELVVHCDTNALASAARKGISLEGSIMWLTGPPCANCLKLIIQAGIVEIVWPRQNPFWDDEARRARWQAEFHLCDTVLFPESGMTYRAVDCPWEDITL